MCECDPNTQGTPQMSGASDRDLAVIPTLQLMSVSLGNSFVASGPDSSTEKTSLPRTVVMATGMQTWAVSKAQHQC